MTSLHSSLPSPGRTTWRKDLSAIARDPNTQYLRIRHVVIRGTEINQKPSPFVVYKIDVVTESNNWFVYKRYSQFHSLHFKLHKKFSLSWDLFPKKLVSGNLDPKNISTRKKLLEHYLQKLINSDSNIAMCEELLHFLDVYYHDVVYVTRSLSSFVFKQGDLILSKQQLFQLSPTEIYCIGKRLKLPVETSPSDACDSSQDLGHLFSFVHQLHNLMIAPRPEIGHFGNVAFDVSVFKSLSYLVLRNIDLNLMEGLQNLQGQILDLRCHNCVSSLDDILVHPVSTQASSPSNPPPNTDSWRIEMTARLVQNKLVLQPWHFLERLDLSYNSITSVSQTLHLLPCLHTLSLNHNCLSQLDLHLFSFISLKHIDVSHNTINLIYRSKTPLLSITSLNVSHNQLQNLDSTDCLPNISYLNFSHNLVHSLHEVDKMLKLQKLSCFDFANNPISSQKNARISIAAKFYVHDKPVQLDGSEITEKEKYKIMANINKYGSNIQNWPNAVSHVSISNVIASHWLSDQTSSRDHHRSLSYSVSNSLLLEDPNYEVSWSHFSSPTGGSNTPSTTSSAISTPVDSVHSPTPPLRDTLSPGSPFEDVFIYPESTDSQQLLLNTNNSQVNAAQPIIISSEHISEEITNASPVGSIERSYEDLEHSHTPIPSGGITPTQSDLTPDSTSGLIIVSKSALSHALALLNLNETEHSLDDSDLTPKPSLICYTSELVTAAIHSVTTTEQTAARNDTPEDSCTMQQVLLEDKITQALNTFLESSEMNELHIDMSHQHDSESNQLSPLAIACVVNERIMSEL